MKAILRLNFNTLLTFSGLILTLSVAVSCSPDPHTPRPNFLILISDDQRFDQLSSAAQPIIPELQTPHLDALAKHGVYFTNAFITTPICAVSRASIMSGRYVSSHGMNHFNTPMAPEVLNQTYAAILHENGYRTGLLGKWGMGTEGAEGVFDVFEAWAHQGVYFHQTDSGKIHNSEWLAHQSGVFLNDCDPDQPFCLTVCFKSPHHPYQPDERDQHLFEEVSIPPRASDTPEAYEHMASHVMDSSLNRWCYFDERRDEAVKNDFEKNFLRCGVSLDRGVGKIMQSLKDLGFDKNTVTIFISDNGYLWGEHGLGGKWLLYEESIRVPLVVHDPRISKKWRGSRPEAMVLNIDLAPTVLDLAGIQAPGVMNGRSLVPLLTSKNVPWRTDFFMEHVGVIEVETPIPDSRGVRTRDWKYIRYVNVVPEVEELYNLQTDPLELNNLARNPDAAEQKARLIDLYQGYLDELNPEK